MFLSRRPRKALFFILCFVLTTLGAYAQEREVYGTDRYHTVMPGENLYTIAKQYSLAIEHIAFANGLSTNSLHVAEGTNLLIPCCRVMPNDPPNNGLVINIPERGAFLFRSGRFEKFYPIAIGQPGKFQTPQGNFSIVNKTENPVWSPPEWAGLGEEPVPAGPNNPLGDRWIGLSAPGIGMHSTTSPTSIGQAASHGCMRMYPNSVRELYEKVHIGWPVRIEYETAKVGYNRDTDSYFVVSFPDVYNQRSCLVAVEDAFAEAGLEVDSSELSSFAQPTGVAKELAVSNVYVMVNNNEFQWPCPPMLLEGTLWGPSRIFSEAGLSVSWDNDDQVVEISRGKLTLLFPVSDYYVINPAKISAGTSARVAGYARKMDGSTIIPLRPVLDTFAIPHQWDNETRTLNVSKMPPIKAKKAKKAQPQVKQTPKPQVKQTPKPQEKQIQNEPKASPMPEQVENIPEDKPAETPINAQIAEPVQ